MTVVNPKSISGINSITMASGSDNLLTIHTTNTTERVRVNSDGDVIVGSGITVSPDGDIFTTGVTTATTFVGALTGNVTGNISGGTVAGSTGTFTGNLSITNTAPQISLVDSDNNSDFSIYGAGGVFNIYDETNSASRLTIASDGTVSVIQGLELSSTLTIPDSIVHSGDTDTKIRFPAADTITFETGGSEKIRIDSSGTISTKVANAQFKSESTSSGDWVRMYAGNGTGQWDIYGNGDHLRFTDNASAGAARFDSRLGTGTHPSHAQLVSYFNGTASYPPSGGLVQTDNDSHGLQVWNGSNSAEYSALKLETKTTGAAIWLMSNVYNSNFSGDLTFITRTGGSSNAERVRFRRDGGVTFNGDTAAANALNDYEEGTYTATMAVTSGSLSVTNNLLSYVKIGDICHVTGRLYPQLSSSGSMGEFTFSLPFAARGSGTSQVQYEQGFILHTFRATEDTDSTNGANRSQRNFRIRASESVARMVARNNGNYGTFGITNPHMIATFTYQTN